MSGGSRINQLELLTLYIHLAKVLLLLTMTYMPSCERGCNEEERSVP